MISVAEAECVYTTAAKKAPGIYLPGLMGDDFSRAAIDGRTIMMPGTPVPIGPAVDKNKWYEHTLDYFAGQIDTKPADMIYYAGFAGLADAVGVDENEAIDHLLREVVARNNVLVFEQSQERDVRPQLNRSLARLGIDDYEYPELKSIGSTPAGNEVTYRPDQVISIAQYQGGRGPNPVLGITGMYEAFENQHNNSGRTQIKRSLVGDQVRRIYGEYLEAFEGVSAHSPIAWVLDEDRFAEIMEEPEFMKIVHLDSEGEVDNMFVVAAVEESEWINQERLGDYLRYRFGEDYEQNPVVSCLLIYSRKDAPKILSLRTFGLLAKVNEAANVAPIAIVECIDANTNDVTGLFERATARAGVSTIAVGEPVLRQTVQVLRAG